jgi:hypothetical protein
VVSLLAKDSMTMLAVRGRPLLAFSLFVVPLNIVTFHSLEVFAEKPYLPILSLRGGRCDFTYKVYREPGNGCRSESPAVQNPPKQKINALNYTWLHVVAVVSA